MANDEPQDTTARSNPPQTFGPLYEQHYSQIFGYVYRRILHWETAQDITAEVFLKAYRVLANLPGPDEFRKVTAYAITTNRETL